MAAFFVKDTILYKLLRFEGGAFKINVYLCAYYTIEKPL